MEKIMSEIKYSGNHTVLTYSYLRNSSNCLLKKAEETEEGNVHTSLASLVMSAFSLEASLNHIGTKLFPFWKDVEKNLSPESKLNFICHELKLKPNFSKRPYQSFKPHHSLKKMGKSLILNFKELCGILSSYTLIVQLAHPREVQVLHESRFYKGLESFPKSVDILLCACIC
jgi:hypothetical protein